MSKQPSKPPLHPSIIQVPMEVLNSYLKQANINSKQCMFCGTIGNYSFNSIIYEFRPFFRGGIAIGGNIPTVPAILIICKNCGDIRFISTIITQMTPQVIANQPPQSKDPLNGR